MTLHKNNNQPYDTQHHDTQQNENQHFNTKPYGYHLNTQHNDTSS
jgi:hypothetical protein